MSNKDTARALHVILDQTEMIKSLQAEVTALQHNAAFVSTKFRNQADTIRQLQQELETARGANAKNGLNALRSQSTFDARYQAQLRGLLRKLPFKELINMRDWLTSHIEYRKENPR